MTEVDLGAEYIIRQTYKEHGMPEGFTLQRSDDGMMRYAAPPATDLGELGTDQVGVTPEGRPMMGNPDGSYSTERSITVDIDGQFYNIPSMYGGKEVSPEEAKRMAIENGLSDVETGREFTPYGTVDEAVAAAQARSDSIAPPLSQNEIDNMKAMGLDPENNPASLTSYDPTMREDARFEMTTYLVDKGMELGTARNLAEEILGNETAMKDLGVGLADMLGITLPMDVEEGVRQADRGLESDNMLDTAIGSGIALASAVPMAGGAVKAGMKIGKSKMVREFLDEAVKRFDEGKSPFPVGMSIEDVGGTPTEIAPVFYSAVANAVDGLPMEKGSAQQMRAMIAKSAEVKPEEMAWIGLDDFLAGKKSVTKQEVKDFVNANQVQVEEVVRGTAPDKGEIRKAFELQNQTGTELTNAALKSEMLEREAYGLSVQIQRGEIAAHELPVELQPLALKHFSAFQEYSAKQEGRKTTTKFGEYTLPGGENYREVLLKLPKKAMTFDEYAAEYKRRAPGIDDATIQERYADYATAPGDDLSPDTFRGGHYDEHNVFAHIRLNDRTGPNGERILFVEEIQSDWHQKGRKQGYKKDTSNLDRELDFVESQLDELAPKSKANYDHINSGGDRSELPFPNIGRDIESFSDRRSELVSEMAKFKDGVPDAPLKKTWHEMSFRRIARMAAEEGYDAIAFTPGKLQAERYDLSKQIDELRYQKNDDGTFNIVPAKDGQTMQENQFENLAEDRLAEVVGKEVAEKIVKGKGVADSGKSNIQILRGVDLEVGGEGMKGFYDKMLKGYADKWGKKFGAKVGVTKIPAVYKGRLPDDQLRSLIDAQKAGGHEVWSLPVTKKMRDSVLGKGVATFGVAATATGVNEATSQKAKEASND